MRRIILEQGEAFDNAHLQRKSAFNAKAMSIATDIVEDVRQRGDEALRELTAKFDGVELETFRVSADVFEAEPDAASRRSRPLSSRRLRRSASSTSANSSRAGSRCVPMARSWAPR